MTYTVEKSALVAGLDEEGDEGVHNTLLVHAAEGLALR